MHRYTKGARFERKIIHNLIDMGALIAIRGAGSKSAGSIKADIMALFPSGYLLIVQAKNSGSKFKKERAAFESHPELPRVLWLWAEPESCEERLRGLEKLLKEAQ